MSRLNFLGLFNFEPEPIRQLSHGGSKSKSNQSSSSWIGECRNASSNLSATICGRQWKMIIWSHFYCDTFFRFSPLTTKVCRRKGDAFQHSECRLVLNSLGELLRSASNHMTLGLIIHLPTKSPESRLRFTHMIRVPPRNENDSNHVDSLSDLTQILVEFTLFTYWLVQ